MCLIQSLGLINLANSSKVNWGLLSDTICSGILYDPNSFLITLIVFSAAVIDFISMASGHLECAQKTLDL